MMRTLGVALLTASATWGCAAGNQPVEWQRAAPIDYRRPIVVVVTSQAPMPRAELRYIQRDIEYRLRRLFHPPDVNIEPYLLQVVITNYDEGDATLRFMIAGAGAMELWGTVELRHRNLSIRQGNFEKTYSLGGIIGASAEMHDDVVRKVGEAIANSLTPGADEYE